MLNTLSLLQTSNLWLRKERKILACVLFPIHGLAGLRIGYGYGSTKWSLLQQARQPFNANSVAQACALAALEDHNWVRQCRKRNLDGLEQLRLGCQRLDLQFVPSQANFLLIKVGDGKEFSRCNLVESSQGPWAAGWKNTFEYPLAPNMRTNRCFRRWSKFCPSLGKDMNEIYSLVQSKFGLFVLWSVVGLWTFYVSLYRAFVDRIELALHLLQAIPDQPVNWLFIYWKPQPRPPFSSEAALLSSLQILVESCFHWNTSFEPESLGSSEAFFFHSLRKEWLRLIFRVVVSTEWVSLQLSIGYPFMLFVRILSFPLSSGLGAMERLLFSKSQNETARAKMKAKSPIILESWVVRVLI